MSTFFSSDQHFGHTNVIGYCNRPFANIQQMNDTLISNWNDIVTNEDHIYVLGDFSMSINSMVEITPKLNGTKYLIPGNHDICHSYHKKSRILEKRENQIKRYEDMGWNVLQEQETILIYGVKFNVCHHPIEMVTEYDDKYKKWRPIDDGRPLLCGHIHQHWKTKRTAQGTLMINVGVDVWDFKPVSQKQISNLYLDSMGLLDDNGLRIDGN